MTYCALLVARTDPSHVSGYPNLSPLAPVQVPLAVLVDFSLSTALSNSSADSREVDSRIDDASCYFLVLFEYVLMLIYWVG